MTGIQIRAVSHDEEALIFSFLYLAARMPEGNEPIQKALSDPFLRKYWSRWGRPGDFGLVAIDEASKVPVSCAWLRVFSKEEAGPSFVEDGLPELGIGTIESFRGKGIAAELLKALIQESKGKFPGICLNVRDDNPSRKIYERLGFQDVPGSKMKNRVGTVSRNMLLKL
ncbi:MAG: GNAT family N-acetyltransferase [Bdellovibrionia bacterium]